MILAVVVLGGVFTTGVAEVEQSECGSLAPRLAGMPAAKATCNHDYDE
jgi:hypothetical protein